MTQNVLYFCSRDVSKLHGASCMEGKLNDISVIKI